MQQYVVIKNFTIGEINKTLRSSQVVGFDGTTLLLGEQKFTAPGLSGAIRRGWLLATDDSVDVEVQNTPAVNPKLNSQALLDKYKVRSAEQSDSELPRKKPQPVIDFSSKVISDEDDDNVPLDEALPSLKAKKAARKSLQDNNDLKSIPSLEVLSDGGEATQLNRSPKITAKKFLDTVPLVNTKNSVPTIEPPSHKRVFGGSELDTEALSTVQQQGIEVLSVPKKEATPVKAEKKAKTAKSQPNKVEEAKEYTELATSLDAKPDVKNNTVKDIPYNWKDLSFRERKEFVENTNDIATLRALLLLEKGAVKKFITSKLDMLSNNA